MKLPDLAFEEKLWKEKFQVIGIDEVGRGAFAGPLTVCGAIFNSDMTLEDKKYLLSLGINDSKKLSPKKRLELSEILKQVCKYEMSFINVETINKIGIGRATFLGMTQVYEKLKSKVKNPHLLIDAFEIPGLNIPQSGIKFGDSLSLSIASASILAKVERDKLMETLSIKFANYGWEKNKGYGTLHHRRAISRLGLTSFHRVQFCASSLLL